MSKEGPIRSLNEDRPEELESVLEVLSNHLRRKIIKTLAREDSYMAALATEVGSSPQALVKHLKALEKNGIIKQYDVNEEDLEQGTFRVRAESKEDRKIKYYALAKNVNLRINFGLGIGLEISGQAWETDDLKASREKTKERYKELLEEFINLEEYIENQLDESLNANEHLKLMNNMLDQFDEIEQFLMIERQLIMIKKLKAAVSYLSDDNCIELRPLFFELLSTIDLDKTKLKAFESKLRSVLPEKAEETIKLLKGVKNST